MDIRSISGSPQQAYPATPVISANNNQNASSVATSNTDQVKNAPTSNDVNKAVKEINIALQASSQNLEFSVDNDANAIVVKIIDQQTRQVLRQIPTVDAIEISKSLDKLQGLLINQQA